MINKRVLCSIFFLFFLVFTHLSYAKSQNTTSEIGLVVQFGDGRIETECIEFEEQSITGYDVLEHSKFDIVFEGFPGQGYAVCKIGDKGCPASDCLTCEAPLFWSYWYLEDNKWNYALIGVSNFDVKNGDVQGWRWGVKGAPDEIISFDEICGDATKTPTKTDPSPTDTLLNTQGQEAVFATDTPRIVSTATNQPATNTNTPNPTNTNLPIITSTRTPLPSQSPIPTATYTHTEFVSQITETSTQTLQPTETERIEEIIPTDQLTNAVVQQESEPTATLSGFQKSDQTAVALSEVSTMESMEVEEPSDVGKSLSKFAILTGGLIGYLFFIVLVVGLGIGLLILMLMRRK
jgi:hypothetical protein